MSKYLSGTVVRAVGGVFDVVDDNNTKYVCFSPKKFRYNDFDVVVGDKVHFDLLSKGKGVISEICKRKNKLRRPEIANVDVCFLVLASQPEPDLYLADKVLINCFQQNITPVIVVNKMDLAVNCLQQITDNYSRVADVVAVTSTNDSCEVLLNYLNDGKVGCFAGQSAVGKTSLLNCLLPDANQQVGNISQKSGRGTHTTRHSSLHKVGNGYLVDTCGFSLCDIDGIRAEELHLYLDEFVTVGHDCKFTSCTHTVEPDCAVKQAVNDGTLNKQRYERYLEEYQQLLELQNNKY